MSEKLDDLFGGLAARTRWQRDRSGTHEAGENIDASRSDTTPNETDDGSAFPKESLRHHLRDIRRALEMETEPAQLIGALSLLDGLDGQLDSPEPDLIQLQSTLRDLDEVLSVSLPRRRRP